MIFCSHNIAKSVDRTRKTITGIIIGILMSLPWYTNISFAEPYIGGYVGTAIGNSATDFDSISSSRNGVPNPSGSIVSRLDDSLTGGLKLGYWFDVFPLVGAELDVYRFSPSAQVGPSTSPIVSTKFDVDSSVTAIGLNFMGRYPLLKSPEFPRGRFQPYAGFGPTLFITKIEDEGQAGLPSNIRFDSKTNVFGGVGVEAGTKFFITKKISLFGEWKFTHFNGVYASSVPGIPGTGNLREFDFAGEQAVNIHHFYAGIAYHFY